MECSYELKYLKLLSKEFPTVQAVSTELINLTAILNLPKGTEHFLTDIHGEYDIFNHFIKNGSGAIKEKINLIYTDMTEKDKNTLAFIIYYPKQMIKKYELLLDEGTYQSFLRDNLLRIIEVSIYLSQKYTKSRIRKSLPQEFSYIIQELLYENQHATDKEAYYKAIIDAIFKTKREKRFIIEMARLIQRLTIDRLHVVGDIFDRGPNAQLIMNKLEKYHSVDIEWGNHDIIWMGAAAGSEISIANVIRISARYNNLDTLEDGYGINLLPLAALADKYYRLDTCAHFIPKNYNDKETIDKDRSLLVAKMHKAMTIIQFKLEHQVIKDNPNFGLDDRLLLDKIDFKNKKIKINGTYHTMNDSFFPTVDPRDPYTLNPEELKVITHLKYNFLNNDLLQRHVNFLYRHGSMYLKYNNNLLFHGCIPLDDQGGFAEMEIDGKIFKGLSLFDELEKKIRTSFLNRYDKVNPDKDYFMFLWQGENSPLFGKKSMKTFERYFLYNPELKQEPKNNYFLLREKPEVLKNIYKEFDISWEKSKIINGHVPVDITKGFSPVIADGRIYSIDGGMSTTYSEQIAIGGYTLVSDSYRLFLISHDRFSSLDDLIEKEEDIISLQRSEDVNKNREYIYDTDKGKTLADEINDLYKLLDAYRDGTLKENYQKNK